MHLERQARQLLSTLDATDVDICEALLAAGHLSVLDRMLHLGQ